MIDNINEIKYPVIVKSSEGECTYLYKSPTSAYYFVEGGIDSYLRCEPIQEEDTICTKEFLQGRYVRVKCPEEMDYIRKLCGNSGMSEGIPTGKDFVCFLSQCYSFYRDVDQDWLDDMEELILPFPESIYQKEGFVSEEFLSQANKPTTEALLKGVEQDFSSSEGDSLADSLHSLSERYTLFYSFHPSEEDSSDKGVAPRSYFLVDYKEASYKVDSVAKVGDLEKMIMIERGLCYD